MDVLFGKQHCQSKVCHLQKLCLDREVFCLPPFLGQQNVMGIDSPVDTQVTSPYQECNGIRNIFNTIQHLESRGE